MNTDNKNVRIARTKVAGGKRCHFVSGAPPGLVWVTLRSGGRAWLATG
jgi:hypothetical protein